MTPIDILGWVATGVVIISFLVKDMLMLRTINSIGTVLWLIYGGLKLDYPLMAVNLLIVITHIIWFIRDKKLIFSKFKQL